MRFSDGTFFPKSVEPGSCAALARPAKNAQAWTARPGEGGRYIPADGVGGGLVTPDQQRVSERATFAGRQRGAAGRSRQAVFGTPGLPGLRCQRPQGVRPCRVSQLAAAVSHTERSLVTVKHGGSGAG